MSEKSRTRLPLPMRIGGFASLVCGVLLSLGISGCGQSSTASPPPVGAGYWHTSGTRILDAYNRPVRIAAVTWFGAEAQTWVPAGLDFQPYRHIMKTVKRLGYNTIRLPFCNQLVEQNPVITGWVKRNPQFLGKHALSVIDAIARYARVIGLKIILDDQISACESASKAHTFISRLDEPLWYTARYPESSWIHDWQALAKRYRGNTAVIGFDIRNEPHTAGPGPWTVATYLHQGSTWGPYRGHDNAATDWRLAAQRCGDAILKVNPKLLIFVEGLQLYPQTGSHRGIDSYWWGAILRPVRLYPVRLSVAHRLVYSPHEYGPQKWPYYWWWRHLTYQQLAGVFDRQWGFILNHPKAPYAAPIFLGETGTCTNYDFCVDAGPQPWSPKSKVRIAHEQGKWLHLLVRFIHLHPSMGWSLWALNGTTALDTVSTDGLLNPTWSGVQSHRLQRLLSTIQ